MTADLERAWGRAAVAFADCGAGIAYRAIIDLLDRHGMHEAQHLVEVVGEESIRIAFQAEAWRDEELPPVGDATGPNVNTSTTTTPETSHANPSRQR